MLALVTALGVGLIAFPSSAAAVPPTVPSCTPKPSPASDSCVRGTVAALDGAIGPTLERVRVGVRTRSVFDPPSDETQRVTLRFDDDIEINLAAVPGACTGAQVSGDTIAQAYNQCGPGPGGSNTYLSPPGNVSGVGSTVIAGVDACTMIFKGANNNQLILYARAPIGNPPSECNNPATNNTGSTTTVFTGTLTNLPPATPYGKQLTVSDTNSPPVSLDDFSATITRGEAFRARCPTLNYKHRMVGIFDYTTTPTDTIAPPYPGTIVDNPRCSTQGNPPPQGRPNTKITKSKIKQRRHKAKFKFKATGAAATGFECKLKRRGHKAKGWKGCSSPKTYRHLKRGRYKFKVRAVGPGGKDNSPAKDKFRIKRRR
jgi:hypothetical protein